MNTRNILVFILALLLVVFFGCSKEEERIAVSMPQMSEGMSTSLRGELQKFEETRAAREKSRRDMLLKEQKIVDEIRASIAVNWKDILCSVQNGKIDESVQGCLQIEQLTKNLSDRWRTNILNDLCCGDGARNLFTILEKTCLDDSRSQESVAWVKSVEGVCMLWNTLADVCCRIAGGPKSAAATDCALLVALHRAGRKHEQGGRVWQAKTLNDCEARLRRERIDATSGNLKKFIDLLDEGKEKSGFSVENSIGQKCQVLDTYMRGVRWPDWAVGLTISKKGDGAR